eukprot:gene26307-28784_t
MLLTPTDIAFGLLLVGLLVALAVADFRSLILPDWLTALVAANGLAASALGGEPPLADALAAATLGGGLLWGLAIAYRRLRGLDGLGFGDVKLVAAGGVWTGLEGLPWLLVCACAGALLYATARAARGVPLGRTDRLPFGRRIDGRSSGLWRHERRRPREAQHAPRAIVPLEHDFPGADLHEPPAAQDIARPKSRRRAAAPADDREVAIDVAAHDAEQAHVAEIVRRVRRCGCGGRRDRPAVWREQRAVSQSGELLERDAPEWNHGAIGRLRDSHQANQHEGNGREHFHRLVSHPARSRISSRNIATSFFPLLSSARGWSDSRSMKIRGRAVSRAESSPGRFAWVSTPSKETRNVSG